MDSDIQEELEERAAICRFDGGVSRYEAGQIACRCITAKYGEKLRPALLAWLKEEKNAPDET